MQGNIENLLVFTVTLASRLDKALAAGLAESVPGLSRARLQALIKAGRVTRDGIIIADPDHAVRAGETYAVHVLPPVSAAPEAQQLPLAIVYEDADLLVVNKAPGMVVHPAAGNRDHTLVNALLAHCGASLSGIGGVARPGIVHRLDKDTSGLMVVAKHDVAHQRLTAQFADRSLSRIYRAVVWGAPVPPAGEIDRAIGRHPTQRQKMAVVRQRGRKGGGSVGKPALTYYKVLEEFGHGDFDKGPLASLVECRLATGRTHQIRVHMAHIKHPIVGDPVYGRRGNPVVAAADRPAAALLQAFPRQALHAGELKFIHPVSGKPMKFKADLPGDMSKLISECRRQVSGIR